MKTIYRKVQCSDRLPEKSGEYLTDMGEVSFDSESQSFYVEFMNGEGYVGHINIAYWLEETQLPTEDDI